jgi:hypothetical protein
MDIGIIIFAAVGWILASIAFTGYMIKRGDYNELKYDYNNIYYEKDRYRDRVDELLEKLDNPVASRTKKEVEIGDVDSTVLDWLGVQ